MRAASGKWSAVKRAFCDSTMLEHFLALVASTSAGAPFQLSNTLGSHAVLQPPVVIWGLGTPGASVRTTVSGSVLPIAAATTLVGADGIWRQPLSVVDQGLAPVVITSSSEGATVTISDVLVGRVFLCSGQSNIDLVTVSKAFNATEELAAVVNFPNVRTAQAARRHAWSGPLMDAPMLSQNWSLPTPTNIATFSATCWFAARDLFQELGGKTAVGVFQSSYGGTAVRNWVPTSALAACSQPWSGQQPYGYNPYTHSTLYNGMIAFLGTGPTKFQFVVWDQAESDSFPQTLPGYYGCQTLGHVNSWRALLDDSLLPWLFVHLQPYTGSESNCNAVEKSAATLWGDSLAELRHAQLSALQLPNVGYASAVDLGDSSSPYGDVHFQNKQTIAERLIDAARAVAFGGAKDASYPAAAFYSQVPAQAGAGMEGAVRCQMTVRLKRPITGLTGAARRSVGAGAVKFSLSMGATPDPGTVGNTSAVCPFSEGDVLAQNCSGFQLLCTTPEVPHNTSNPAIWVAATATIGADEESVVLTAVPSAAAALVARGSRYAWSAWPLATLFANPGHDHLKWLPVLPWNQGLTCTNGAEVGAPC